MSSEEKRKEESEQHTTISVHHDAQNKTHNKHTATTEQRKATAAETICSLTRGVSRCEVVGECLILPAPVQQIQLGAFISCRFRENEFSESSKAADSAH